jgi:hypothetical protein
VSAGDYVRAIEQHVCQKNDGHVIRVVGPGFEVVCRWERDGVPLKVALSGIDRYFARYYRNGPKRRPVRVEFCDADVLDVFDEWRRAVGVAARAGVREDTVPDDAGGQSRALATGAATFTGRPEDSAEAPAAADKGRGPSLPAHLQRVVTRLSSARATGRLASETDAVIDQIADELDRARADTRGLRGDSRHALIERLATLDRLLMETATRSMTPGERGALEDEARGDLAAFRDRLAPEAYELALRRSLNRLIRDRLALPVVTFD